MATKKGTSESHAALFYLTRMVWFRSPEWWGNSIYLVGSLGYAFLDFMSAYASGNPIPSFIGAEVIKVLWVVMATLFLVDAIIYWFAWAQEARRTAVFKSEPVRVLVLDAAAVV